MFADVEELKRRALEDLERHGLQYALNTLRYNFPPFLSADELVRLEVWLMDEFLQRKDVRVEEWRDDDLEGVRDFLGNQAIPYDVRLRVYRALLDFYSRGRNSVSMIIKDLRRDSPAWRIVKGLIILMENFELFAEVKRPEELVFPTIEPPEPRPKDELLDEVVSVVEGSKQAILLGPPGTGKTHLAMWAAHKLTNGGSKGCWVLVQFHRSYRYDDFIERVVLKPHGRSIELVIEPQIFVRLCRYAQQHPERSVVLVIDEINRADVASVFGELIYAIEYRGYPVKLTYSKEDLVVPENLYIIATANDIERGTFDIGVALRRRFEVIRIDASEEALRELLTHENAEEDVINTAVEIFNRVNDLFKRSIGKKGIGHLFFRGVKDKETLIRVWRFRIKPLIEAYFMIPGVMAREVQQLIRNIETRLNELR